MSEIWDVEVGFVTNRRNARLHLVVDGGYSYCPSGTGVIIRSRKASGYDAPNVCKRCRKALRARLVDVRNIRSRRPDQDSRAIVDGCDALLDGMTTPAERAEFDAMLDGIRRDLTATCGAATKPRMIHTTTTPTEDDQPTLF
jgi:hypothetical protein